MRYKDTNLPGKHLHRRKRAVRRPPISTCQKGSWGRSSFKREVEVCPKKPQAYKHGASLENSKYQSNMCYVWLHQICRKAAILWQTVPESRASSLLCAQSPLHRNSPKRSIQSKKVKGSPWWKAERCAKTACSSPSFTQRPWPRDLFKRGHLMLGKPKKLF